MRVATYSNNNQLQHSECCKGYVSMSQTDFNRMGIGKCMKFLMKSDVL